MPMLEIVGQTTWRNYFRAALMKFFETGGVAGGCAAIRSGTNVPIVLLQNTCTNTTASPPPPQTQVQDKKLPSVMPPMRLPILRHQCHLQCCIRCNFQSYLQIDLMLRYYYSCVQSYSYFHFFSVLLSYLQNYPQCYLQNYLHCSLKLEVCLYFDL